MLRKAQVSTSQMWSKLFGDARDDEASSKKSSEDGLECPLCWEEFNNSDNLPYVLWCGHTLCKSCVMSLQWAVVKLPVVPVQLPLFITCPWCQFLSCRLVWKGKLKYPCKNFFLLWMVETAGRNNLQKGQEAGRTGQKISKSSMTVPLELTVQYQGNIHCHLHRDQRQSTFAALTNSDGLQQEQGANGLVLRRWFRSLMAVGMQLASKLTLLLLLLFMLLYVLPFTTMILLVYIVVTLVFAFPSFLIIYFAFPSLGWLFREIVT